MNEPQQHRERPPPQLHRQIAPRVTPQTGTSICRSAQTWGTGINNKQFTVTESNNRLVVPSGQSGTMTYDAAGNLTTDTYSGAGVTRVYDADNRMVSETAEETMVAIIPRAIEVRVR